MNKVIYIQWTEQQQEFDNWRVVSGLGCEPVFKTKVVKRKVRFSSNCSVEMKTRAEKYIQSDMQDRPDAKVIIVTE